MGSFERPNANGLREPLAEVLPAVTAYLLVDTVATDIGFLAVELLRRARRILDLEGYSMAGPVLGHRLAAQRAGVHSINDRTTTT